MHSWSAFLNFFCANFESFNSELIKVPCVIHHGKIIQRPCEVKLNKCDVEVIEDYIFQCDELIFQARKRHMMVLDWFVVLESLEVRQTYIYT